MVEINKEILKGHIDTLLLSVLKKKDMYGYEMAKQIKLKCNEQFELKEGTLYLALKRLEKNQYVHSYWNDEEETGGGKRKYYQLTSLGEEELNRKMKEWEFMKKIMNNFLGGLEE